MSERYRKVHWYGNPFFAGCHVAVFTQSKARRIFRPAALTNEPEQVTCEACKAGLTGYLVKIPQPAPLKRGEYMVIENKYPGVRDRFSAAPDAKLFPPGCEHDAHGICTVMQKQEPKLRYRLAIYTSNGAAPSSGRAQHE